MRISQMFTMSVVCRFCSLLLLFAAGCVTSDDDTDAGSIDAPAFIDATVSIDADPTDAESPPQPLNFPRCECTGGYPCDATAYCGSGTVCEGGGICYLSCETSADCDTVPGWDTCAGGHCYP